MGENSKRGQGGRYFWGDSNSSPKFRDKKANINTISKATKIKDKRRVK